MNQDEMKQTADDFKRDATALLAKIKAGNPRLTEEEARVVLTMSYFKASRSLALELEHLKSDLKSLINAALNQTWQIKMVGDGSFQYVLPWYTVTESEYLSWPGRKRHMYVVADVDPVSPPYREPDQERRRHSTLRQQRARHCKGL